MSDKKRLREEARVRALLEEEIHAREVKKMLDRKKTLDYYILEKEKTNLAIKGQQLKIKSLNQKCSKLVKKLKILEDVIEKKSAKQPKIDVLQVEKNLALEEMIKARKHFDVATGKLMVAQADGSFGEGFQTNVIFAPVELQEEEKEREEEGDEEEAGEINLSDMSDTEFY